MAHLGRYDRAVTLLGIVMKHALRVAMRPKNVKKGGWDHLSSADLALHVMEEVGETARAIRKGRSIGSIESEIGDAVWSLAMLYDAVIRERNAHRVKTETCT